MTAAVADTHSLVWYLLDSPELGKEADKIFAACDRGEALIYIPTICLVELIYLQEKGKIPSHLMTELLSNSSNLVFADLSAEVVAALATIPRDHVPDMPDRIIAATARHLELPLVSRDRQIQTSSIETIW